MKVLIFIILFISLSIFTIDVLAHNRTTPNTIKIELPSDFVEPISIDRGQYGINVSYYNTQNKIKLVQYSADTGLKTFEVIFEESL